MKPYLVTFDLNRAGQDYVRMHDAIKSLGNYQKIATTTYIIKSSSSAASIRDYLRNKMDGNDELFVAALTGEWASTGLSASVVDWLKTKL